jgi:hypothetical protein
MASLTFLFVPCIPFMLSLSISTNIRKYLTQQPMPHAHSVPSLSLSGIIPLHSIQTALLFGKIPPSSTNLMVRNKATVKVDDIQSIESIPNRNRSETLHVHYLTYKDSKHTVGLLCLAAVEYKIDALVTQVQSETSVHQNQKPWVTMCFYTSR